MIEFAVPESIEERLQFVRKVAQDHMRPAARPYDDTEHQVPWDFVRVMWNESLRTGYSFRSGAGSQANGSQVASQTLLHVIEMLSWGDAGIYLCGPGAGLGGPPSRPRARPSRRSASSSGIAGASRSGRAWP